MANHKILTDYREEDQAVEVAIDVTDSPLGSFEHSAYVRFMPDGSIIVPFSGDRHVLVNDQGVSVKCEDEVLAHFDHEE